MGLFCKAAMLLGLLSVPGWSDQVLYSNGGILGGTTGGSYNIGDQPQSGIFDTFSISSASTMTGVSDIGLWVASGDTPLSLSWTICVSICVDASGNPVGVLASGSGVSLTSGIFETGVSTPDGLLDIYSASFSVTNLDLSPNTYTLELYDAIDARCPGCSVGWDVNGGPSTAYVTIFGSPGPSNSFQVEGNLSGTGPVAPEPGTFLALGTGLVAISLLMRDKANAYLFKFRKRRLPD